MRPFYGFIINVFSEVVKHLVLYLWIPPRFYPVDNTAWKWRPDRLRRLDVGPFATPKKPGVSDVPV